MTVLTAELGHLARDTSRANRFHVEFVSDWQQAASRWNDPSLSTPFQDTRWLEAWYAAFANVGDVEPLIAIVSDAATSEQVALLPLVRRVRRGVRIIEFADLNLTDYNAPRLTRAAPPHPRPPRFLSPTLPPPLPTYPRAAAP